MSFLVRPLLGVLVFGGSASIFASAPEPPTESAEMLENHPVARSLAALLGTLARTDPAAAFATYGSDLWKYGDGFLNGIGALRIWAERDPAAPLVWLGEQPLGRKSNSPYRWVNVVVPSDADYRPIADALLRAGSLHHPTLEALCHQWGENQPGEALEWISSLTDPALRVSCLEKASAHNFRDRCPFPAPEQTMRMVLALPESEHRVRRLEAALVAWCLRDPVAAEAWVDGQSAPDVAPALIRAHANIARLIDGANTSERLGYLALRDPAAAIAEWEALPDDRIKATAIDLITRAWGERDPASALRWSLPRQKRFEDLGIHALVSPGAQGWAGADQAGWEIHTNLVYAWSKTAPSEAVSWAEEAPCWRDSILYALGGSSKTKPARRQTAELYLLVRDPELRIGTLRRHVIAWAEANPAAARAWVETNPALTPDQRTKILAPKS